MNSSTSTSTTILVLGATGHVGKHVVASLLSLAVNLKIIATTRNSTSPEAQALLSLSSSSPSLLTLSPLDLLTATSLELAEICKGHSAIFFSMPQAFSPTEMRHLQQKFVHALDLLKQKSHKDTPLPIVVKLSSYNIDKFSLSQGPLGNAHRDGEALFHTHTDTHTLISLRPTSFFSNFLLYDFPSLLKERRIRSPLGRDAKVNWVACEDIGRIAAEVIWERACEQSQTQTKTHTHTNTPQDEIIDVVGPPQHNTLSAPEMCTLLTECLQKYTHTHTHTQEEKVEYEELPLPSDDSYRALWLFLRAGGFDVQDERTHTDTPIQGENRISRRVVVGKITFREYVLDLLRAQAHIHTQQEEEK